jgi:Skp family chaperone for outer membrane proteins
MWSKLMTDVTQNQDVNATTTQAANPAPTPTLTSAATEGSPKREYTQAELDDLFRDRAKRAETSTLNRVLKLLGVNSEDELPTLKTTIDKAREIEQANMSAAEKAEKAATAALTRASELEQQLNAERLERRNDRIETELRAALTAAKANNPKTVLSYILVNHRDAMQSLLTDDGKIDEKAMTALVETVKKEDATLFTPPSSIPGSRSNADGRHIPQNQQVQINRRHTAI